MNKMEAGEGGNLPTSESKFKMQRLEQIEQDKRALEAKVGAVQRDIEEVKTKKEQEWYVQTWENNGKSESQNPIARVTAMLEKPKLIDAKQKSKDYLDAKVISVEANEGTYEKLGKFETAFKKRTLVFIERLHLPKIKKKCLPGVRNWKIICLIMSGKQSQIRE